jgi:hypothetical protein
MLSEPFRSYLPFAENSPSRALQVTTFNFADHSSQLVKLRKWEGFSSSNAVELKKLNNNSYVRTESYTASRFNKWIVSERKVMKARWLGLEMPVWNGPDVKVDMHNRWIWNC